MRALPARRIATSALCATLLLGISGPAAVAAGDGPARVHTHAAAPVPGADALLTQVQSLANISGVLAPVTDLLSAALKAEGGQLPAADATKLSQAVKDAIAKATAALPAVPAAPSVPTLPSTPALPATPAVPSLKNSDERGDSEARGDVEGRRMTDERRHADQAGSQDDKAPRAKGARAAANLAADALVALQKAVDTLVKAVTSGDATQVVPAATAVVTGLVNFVVAVVLGGGLPAPNLPGLPALPSLPAT